MPFLKLESNIPEAALGIWKIEEDEMFFLNRVKLYENEWKRLAGISHPQKRLEWLSSRLCLKELIKIADTTMVESLNTDSGKPFLSNQSHHISYSHSDNYSSAIASKIVEVGIDIESRRRKRNPRTRHLFMTDEELAAYERHPQKDLFLLIWSAKEALYKLVGEGFSFREHIALQIADLDLKPNGTFPAIVEKDDFERHYAINYLIRTDFVLTYTAVGV